MSREFPKTRPELLAQIDSYANVTFDGRTRRDPISAGSLETARQFVAVIPDADLVPFSVRAYAAEAGRLMIYSYRRQIHFSFVCGEDGTVTWTSQFLDGLEGGGDFNIDAGRLHVVDPAEISRTWNRLLERFR